jgi:hypothetical protein
LYAHNRWCLDPTQALGGKRVHCILVLAYVHVSTCYMYLLHYTYRPSSIPYRAIHIHLCRSGSRPNYGSAVKTNPGVEISLLVGTVYPSHNPSLSIPFHTLRRRARREARRFLRTHGHHPRYRTNTSGTCPSRTRACNMKPTITRAQPYREIRVLPGQRVFITSTLPPSQLTKMQKLFKTPFVPLKRDNYNKCCPP